MRIDRRVLVGVFGCAIVGALVVLARNSAPLGFLQGHSADPAIRIADVYHLDAKFDDLHRDARLSLTKRGFSREWEQTNAAGRTVCYQSPTRATQVYLVARKNVGTEVDVWIDKRQSATQRILASRDK